MPEHQDTQRTKANNNVYLQPFVVASLAAIFGFGYIYYYRGEIARALIVGGVIFLTMFWVVLRGGVLKKRRETSESLSLSTASTQASGGRGARKKNAIACAVLMGIPLVGYLIYAASAPVKTDSSIQSTDQQGDEIKRVRKVEMIFWKELSKNPHPSFASSVDAAVDGLKFSVHNYGKELAERADCRNV